MYIGNSNPIFVNCLLQKFKLYTTNDTCQKRSLNELAISAGSVASSASLAGKSPVEELPGKDGKEGKIDRRYRRRLGDKRGKKTGRHPL